MKKINVAVVGASGAVGQVMIKVLEESCFPVDKLFLLTSQRSVGKSFLFRGKMEECILLDDFDFSQVSIALFSAGAEVSAKFAPIATSRGCTVIDNTSHFRNDPRIPLVVPEVNPAKIGDYVKHGIIANPNCSTVQMLVALKPLYDEYGISHINVCTYQAVSGAGNEAVDELEQQTKASLQGEAVVGDIYPKQIAFNAIPQIDVFMENGYTREEMKMVWETRKILEDDAIGINATAVRIPVFNGHSEVVSIKCRQPPDLVRVYELLNNFPAVEVIDERKPGGFPTAVTEADGSDKVFVGRVRTDISCSRGISMWVVSDNLRKGAATNSVQIARILLDRYF